MKELNLIIDELRETLNSKKIEVTGNCLFENAVKIYISNEINKNKKYGIYNDKSKQLNNEMKTEEQRITERQKFKLKKLKYNGTLDISKLEASKLIDSLLGTRK